MKEANESRSDSVLDTVASLPGLFVGICNTMGVFGSTGILMTRYSFGHLVNMAGVVLDSEEIDGFLESACTP